jgi:hypothetical protein
MRSGTSMLSSSFMTALSAVTHAGSRQASTRGLGPA